ncbi:hypothetical protein VM1G_02436 [Cytospora mali]|uniref:Uncharacterized protein n=1 Tax=Cytospora mali TaxID=578113 RepID=A0A194VSV1_CYTMA|nr:hypothetical protein VM1G_02436 [Valsa mali]
MTAQEPSIELQAQQQQQKEQQPRDNGDDNQQQRAGDRLSNIGTAQSSLGIEPVSTRMGKGTDSNHGGATSPDFKTWSPKNPSTTVDSEIPSWPFQEDHQPKPPNELPNLKPAPRPSHFRHILQHWYLEILTIFVSTVLMTAIIILLSTYNGKQMPEWPYSINLNTVIATLSTFLRAAMLAAVAEIIGQVKWTWFTERTRPLHHLQDFDSASRSMLGSMRLLGVVLWNYGWTSAGFLGSAAALVTILSLAVGPFTQQALKTTTCPITVPNATAAIPAAYYVPGSSSYYRTGAGMFEVEVDMKSAMIEGLTYPDGKDNDVETTCDGSNCAWPDFGTGVTHATIGLCSACINTTDYVTGPNWGGNLTLPDYEAYINYQRGQYMWVGYSNLTWASDSFTEEFASAASVAVSNFSMLVATTTPCTKRPNSGFYDCPHNVSSTDYYNGLGGYIATSCALYPCMKEYYGSSLGSRFRERLVRTSTAVPNKQETSGYTAYYNYTAIRSPCVLEDGITFNTSNLTHSLLEAGTWYTTKNMSHAPHVAGRTWANITLEDSKGNDYNTSVPNACLYKMDAIYASALQYFMSYTLFTGSCYYDSSQAGHLNCGDSWWLTPLWVDMNATFASLTSAIDDFSTAVTNKLRSTGAGPDVMLGDPLTKSTVLGLVYASSTCTYFDWRWVSFPAVLVFICALLLGWTLIKNYRDPDQPVWKGSVLPLIFLGLHDPGVAPGPHPGVAMQPEPRGLRRLDSMQNFIRENGRSAPELGRIKEDAGRMWVRFHGGNEPGFMELGSKKNSNLDAEASAASLLASNTMPTGRDVKWSEVELRSVRRARSSTMI